MNLGSLRRLLDVGFYEHGLDEAWETCAELARSSGGHRVTFLELGNIFALLSRHFEMTAPITFQESERLTAIYREPMTQLFNLLEANAPAAEIASSLERLVTLHTTVHL